MHKLLKQGILLFRRVSVLYMFFLFLLLAFVLYQYKIKPDNEDELHDRGQRILNQLVQNFLQKDKGLKEIFDDSSSTYNRLSKKEENLGKLWDIVPYSVAKLKPVTQKKPAKNNAQISPVVRFKPGENWELTYSELLWPDSVEVSVALADFTRPLLGARKDIFSSFLLLLDSNNNASSARNLSVLYVHDNVSVSPAINLDTLKVLQKNSDLSAVTSITISGNQFKIFVYPFRYYNQRLLFAGLIPADKYSRLVSTTPIIFIPVFIISILLLLIFLPFLKLFFLSPHESVSVADLRAAAVAMYAGSAIFLMIVFYLFANLFLSNTYNTQLLETGSDITHNIENEINLASQELDIQDVAYASKPKQAKQFLAHKKDIGISKSNSDAIDVQLTPACFQNTSRIFWFDSTGRTLAKWNAFDFVAPLTSVQNLSFFTQLQEKYPKNAQGAHFTAQMSCGKSNATGEFQVFFTKPSSQHMLMPDNSSADAYGICLAGFVSCSNHAYVPDGFGFCVINNSGEVLIHSDSRRNLSENIFEESENNQSLRAAMQNKNGSHLSDIRLYGAETKASVMPVKNQPLFVVTFYEKQIINNQILQAIQFAAMLFVSTYACVLLCLWFATYTSEKPGQLLFKINKIEWIRPSQTNVQAYNITIKFFILMGCLYLATVTIALLDDYDSAIIVYLSVLLPFYSLLGYIFIRKTDNSGGKYKASAIVTPPLIFILLINTVIFILLPVSTVAGLTEFLSVLLFQASAFIILFFCYRYHKKNKAGEADEKISPTTVKDLYRQYFLSLGCSILLITLFPAGGLLIYSWTAQTVQSEKSGLLRLAGKFEERRSFFKNEMFQDYKPAVSAVLNASGFFDTLACSRGIYQPGGSGIEKPGWHVNTNNKNEPPNGDELFYTFNEYLYSASGEASAIPLQDMASDGSWKFYKDSKHGQLKLNYTAADTSIQEMPVTISAFSETIIGRICQSGFLLLLLLGIPPILFFLGIKLIRGIINRLFLQNDDSFNIKPDLSFLSDIFKDSPRKEYYLSELVIPDDITVAFFKIERQSAVVLKTSCKPEDIIIANTDCFSGAYESIWLTLSQEEQYILFDFSKDRLTNYKNTGIIKRLIRKGILENPTGTPDVFAHSFRNYILAKAGTPAIDELNKKFEQPGVWSSIKIPLLSLMAVIGLFILLTQSEVTHRITGFLASITALFPLLLSLLDKKTATAEGSDSKKDQ